MYFCFAILASAIGRADELDELITQAFSNSPALQGAREGLHQASAVHEATGEFLDPRTTAAAPR